VHFSLGRLTFGRWLGMGGRIFQVENHFSNLGNALENISPLSYDFRHFYNFWLFQFSQLFAGF
jgi:hypothetical protein